MKIKRKQIFRSLIAVCMTVAACFGAAKTHLAYNMSNNSLLLAQVEALTDDIEKYWTQFLDKYGSDCVSGGKGASECSNTFTLQIDVVNTGGQISFSCQTKCNTGYACCSVTGCTCK